MKKNTYFFKDAYTIVFNARSQIEKLKMQHYAIYISKYVTVVLQKPHTI